LCGTVARGFSLTWLYLMPTLPALSREGKACHPEVNYNGLLPSSMRIDGGQPTTYKPWLNAMPVAVLRDVSPHPGLINAKLK
jgi:hypothetical protein